ncbi:DUF3782 domain-containing protein [candidate division KSB1 bacterium]|nr:DUF3782 domain-containing protein [candidate division KSB1 bacterium]
MTTLERLEELIYKGFKETDERIARLHRETQKEIDKVAKQLGGVTESLGRFSEQGVLAAVKQLFDKRGIPLNHLFRNLAGHLNGDTMETDVIGVGPEHAVLIEVKLRLRQSHVKEFLEKKMPRFFKFFPNQQRPVLYGGVAGMSIDEDADRFAYKQGLFIITQSGENLRIINDKKFKPRSFAPTNNNHLPKRKAK